MLRLPPWMQPPPKARLWIQGKPQKHKGCRLDIAAGVFSETLDYSEGENARPSFSFRTVKTVYKCGEVRKAPQIMDKGAALLPKRLIGTAPLLRNNSAGRLLFWKYGVFH